ncbi:PilN domain-containing protein [Rhodoferax antarcticus]|uniref:Fimbrial assembly family protein n=1 Tax=Rhodoferax antarcticus ANT.BR TaxID=1111071 RepID=A0A1Q8YKY9_9BURK|nr:PilN domain-containing protein [Rhodoferax antarcticus]APW47487.1 fimbrial protein [Rhodoferax antarcticus]OLP08623.1 fimbrial assembly family protein [Rhodoferax antarcticus ANT.BR]
MILINLLPHREAARKRRKDMFNAGLGLSALAGGLVAGLIFLWFQSQISDQQDKNQILKSQITEFDRQIKDIAGLESEIAALRARQQAVEDLQADRNMPVHLLTELVKQLPEGVYINSMRQEGQNVVLQGVAQSNERVSELLRNLSSQSVWLTQPDLIEIVAGSVSVSPRDQRRVANFKINVKLVRAGEVENKASVAATAGTPVNPVLAASFSVAR